MSKRRKLILWRTTHQVWFYCLDKLIGVIDEDDDSLRKSQKRDLDLQAKFLLMEHLEIDKPIMNRRVSKRAPYKL